MLPRRQLGGWLVGLVMGLGALPALAAPEAVRRLPSSGSSIHFLVEVPEARLTPFLGEDGLSRLELDGYESGGPVGAPALPLRMIVVAVPPSGEVRVRAFGSEPTTIEDALLAPMPRLVGERGAERERYDRSARSYASAAGATRPLARVVGVSWIRNQRVARIAVEPAAYDPSSRRVSIVAQVDVQVDVTPSEMSGPAAEPDDPFEPVYRDLLVNYEQGRLWRRTAAMGEDGRPRNETLLRVEAVLDTSSVYAGRLWVKIAITQSGFYRVDFSQVRNSALFSGDTTTVYDSLRLFTWPGLPVLPENVYCDSCGYRQVAFQYSDFTTNGMFSNNRDYIYFYALGPSDWTDVYDPAQGDSVYLNNPYETQNYYYLTIATAAQPVPGGKRYITLAPGAPTGGAATTPTSFSERVHSKLESEYFPDATPLRLRQDMAWEKWFWRSLGIGQSFTANFDAIGMDLAQPGRVRARMWGIASFDTCYYSGLPPSHLVDFTLNGTMLNQLGWDQESGATFDTTLAGGLRTIGNQLRLSVPSIPRCRLREDRVALAWVDLFYRRRLEAVAGELAFVSPNTIDNFLFNIDSLRVQNPRVFDVTDPYAPVEVTGFVSVAQSPGLSWRLSFERPQTGLRRYRVIPDASIAKLPNAGVFDAPFTSLENLRSADHAADYLVIYYDAFRTAADSLAAWRKVRLPLATKPGPYETLVVPVSALYDQYSGGRTDPAALRSFLRSTLNWRVKPAFVTLLGDASYDFKNITGRALAGQPGTLVPSYENGYDPSVFGGRQFATDDWILNVNAAADVLPDFYGGRIPVNDATSALQYVRDKLLSYERNAPLGENRNRVLFVADDDKQGGSDDGLHWTHLDQTGRLDSTSTPLHIDRDYVFLHKYPDGPGDTKPGAKSDIKKYIAEGVTMFNYIGHGSPFKISDEGVFLDVDTGTLTNANKLFVFVGASCDVGKFNDPAVQSLGERLILRNGGGAIGVVSATELALSSQNAALNRKIYDKAFERDSVTGNGQYYRSLAEGLLAAKLASTETTQKYQLMGDAALRLNLPRRWVDISVWDSVGTTPLTELHRGQTVTFKGRVLDRPGGAPVSVSGVVSLLIEDSAPRETAPPCTFVPSCYRPQYYYKAGPIFRGDAQMNAGQIQGRFVVPLEAAIGARGRLRAYGTGRAAGESFEGDAVGSIGAQFSPGTSSTGDSEGPRITLSFVGGATSVRPDAVLRVDLFDQSGILVTGHTPQNGIVVTIDDNTTARADITSSFRYAADSYQSGFASFQLPNLSPGPHRISVSAADNLALGLGAGAHRSQASLDFEVRDNPPLNVARTYLFPDPTASGGAASGGQFIIDAPGDSVNVLLRVYTVAGRLIRVLKSAGGIGQVQIPWDGFDEEGDRLANGVYLYKVYVYNRDDDGSSSPVRRAIGEGRFVIIRH